VITGEANMNTKHVFLTGEKQVGKSTLVRRLTALSGGRVSGFKTVRAGGVLPGRFTVHMLRAGAEDAPSEENLLFVCRCESPEKDRRFDALGCALLADTAGAALIVMDELGPNERGAKAFQRAVLDTLDGSVPVLGVLQRAESAFLASVAAHPDVDVVEVTRENREELLSMLAKRRPFSSGD